LRELSRRSRIAASLSLATFPCNARPWAFLLLKWDLHLSFLFFYLIENACAYVDITYCDIVTTPVTCRRSSAKGSQSFRKAGTGKEEKE
jgi:hypothetical protein